MWKKGRRSSLRENVNTCKIMLAQMLVLCYIEREREACFGQMRAIGPWDSEVGRKGGQSLCLQGRSRGYSASEDYIEERMFYSGSRNFSGR